MSLIKKIAFVGLQVRCGKTIVQHLTNRFQFTQLSFRVTQQSCQWILRQGGAVLLVSEMPTSSSQRSEYCSVGSGQLRTEHHHKYNRVHEFVDANTYRGFLYDHPETYPVDSACNVAFEVSSVDKMVARLRAAGCEILAPPHTIGDSTGEVSVAIVASPVGNVRHTLVERIDGDPAVFLPGFVREHQSSFCVQDSSHVDSVDHVTYALPPGQWEHVLAWYSRNFDFKRHFVNRLDNEKEGCVLQGVGVGMRLAAMNVADCMLVLAESIPGPGLNQVAMFLSKHQGPGIQHLALHSRDIVEHVTCLQNSGVDFFRPPVAYYKQVLERNSVSKKYCLEILERLGILLDMDEEGSLLQAFTLPIFKEDTFFLEIIQRCHSRGFGAGNIRALWHTVQAYMDG
uniref:4-hydroxyphenylpyruvate dioxygenase-like protein n=1 Tax=Myxine glutinosa TaxID=7769 RepID=UPI00358F7CBA